MAWFNLWAQIIFLPGTLIPFLKHGILARNGLLAFWIPVGLFTVWMIVLSVMLFRAIKDEEHQYQAGQNSLAKAGTDSSSSKLVQQTG